MNNRLKQPCRECPFRRIAPPGYLGSAEPQWFVDSAVADRVDYGPGIAAAPCHLTVDYSTPGWEERLPDADACIGSLQFAANWMKLPRDPVRSAMVSDAGENPDVFATPEEFLAHHNDPDGLRSWEHAR